MSQVTDQVSLLICQKAVSGKIDYGIISQIVLFCKAFLATRA